MDGIQRFFKFEPISASCCVGNDDIFTIMLHWIILPEVHVIFEPASRKRILDFHQNGEKTGSNIWIEEKRQSR